AVGAAHVADAPAAVGGADLGVVAANGGVVDHDLQRIKAANAEERGRIPRLPLGGAVDPAETNERGHPNIPLFSVPRRGVCSSAACASLRNYSLLLAKMRSNRQAREVFSAARKQCRRQREEAQLTGPSGGKNTTARPVGQGGHPHKPVL